MPNECDKVITIPQYSGTCWFNALLMAFFYSEGVRNVLKATIKKSDLPPKSRKIFTDILKRRYKAHVMKQQAYLFFKVITPEEILRILNEEAPEKFNFKPYERIGYLNITYIPRLLEMFGVNALHLDAAVTGKTLKLYYSIIYTDFRITTVQAKDPKKKKRLYIEKYKLRPVEVNVKKPSIIVVRFYQNNRRFYDANLFAEIPVSDFESEKPIVIAGGEYLHDSLLLANFNIETCSMAHHIAGVTCENTRFLYNGWTRTTIDPAQAKQPITNASALPCELMPFDWLQNGHDFCIDLAACGMREAIKKDAKRDLCFNMSKGERTFLLVNKKYRK